MKGKLVVASDLHQRDVAEPGVGERADGRDRTRRHATHTEWTRNVVRAHEL